MSLSCYCESDDADWWFEPAADFSFLGTKRARKCCSCNARLKPGDEVLKFTRWRNPAYGSIEEKIFGEYSEIYMADWFMCEACGGLYMALSELGFCVSLGDDNMADLAKEYGEMQREALARAANGRARMAKVEGKK